QDTALQDNKSSNLPVYTKKEEQKVFNDINFGISKDKYQQLMSNETTLIGGYEFELIPNFNQDGQLYSLTIKSLEKQSEGDHAAKGYLVELIKEKYGTPNAVFSDRYRIAIENNEKIIVRYPREVKTYNWNIGNKTITISAVSLEDQDLLFNDDAPFYIYALMDIFNEKMLKELLEVKANTKKDKLRDEADKF